ncbi:response regulator [Candidatus Venteria ishoeyi]|uniref:Response regulator SaeR n=1 Tax=Candidatus Venteria ishoeyi TaxID=1899563 RepID=A0A1H6FBL3_9GAMM|nr:response regulator [Candidatus Venteria ishoeyi]SEH07490.1 Response regulator SaeR [Candidatus Venteria ishoeyi]
MERQYRLLIIDDEDAILDPYQAFFRKRKFHVDTAHNGKEGLEKLHQDEFDVAIVDIAMPVMDGISMIRAAREAGIDTDFILLTGHGGEKEAVEALNLHVEAWFYKHEIELPELLEKVQEFAEGMPLDEVRRVLSVIPEGEPV